MRVTMRDALPERLHDLVASDGSVDLAAMLPAGLGEITEVGQPGHERTLTGLQYSSDVDRAVGAESSQVGQRGRPP